MSASGGRHVSQARQALEWQGAWDRPSCQTPGMADFRVFASGVSTFYSGEAARYQVSAGGVLTVFDGKGTRFMFSPSGWLSVEDQPEVDIPEVEFPE